MFLTQIYADYYDFCFLFFSALSRRYSPSLPSTTSFYRKLKFPLLLDGAETKVSATGEALSLLS